MRALQAGVRPTVKCGRRSEGGPLQFYYYHGTGADISTFNEFQKADRKNCKGVAYGFAGTRFIQKRCGEGCWHSGWVIPTFANGSLMRLLSPNGRTGVQAVGIRRAGAESIHEFGRAIVERLTLRTLALGRRNEEFRF